MQIYRPIVLFLFLFFSFFLSSCTPVKSDIDNKYTLYSASNQRLASHPHALAILVTNPEAVANYDTEEMLYMDKPYKLEAFARNEWVSPPADMLFPLIVQSLQASGYFYAVASTATSENIDYRLDTQLLELKQNFLVKPSILDFSAKVVLTKTSTNHVLASRIINKHIVCSANSPYGGVIAANQAVKEFTKETTEFVIAHSK